MTTARIRHHAESLSFGGGNAGAEPERGDALVTGDLGDGSPRDSRWGNPPASVNLCADGATPMARTFCIPSRLVKSQAMTPYSMARDPSVSAKNPGMTLSHVEIFQNGGVLTIVLKQRIEIIGGANVGNVKWSEYDHAIDNSVLFGRVFKRYAQDQLIGQSFTPNQLLRISNLVADQYRAFFWNCC